MTTTSVSDNRRRWLIALGLFALAVVLRMINVGRWSFWVDEVATVWRAEELLATGAVEEDWPKLSLLLNGLAMRALGESQFSARIASVVVGAATIPLLYLAAGRLTSQRAGFWAALFMAISPWHIFFCQNARYYAMLILLMVVVMVLLCGDWGRPRGRQSVWRYGLIAVVFGLAFLERLYAAIAVPALGAFAICRIWPALFGRRKAWQRLALAYLLMLGMAGIAVAVVFLWVRGTVPVVDKILTYISLTIPMVTTTEGLSQIISNAGMPMVALAVAGLFLPRDNELGLTGLSALLVVHSILALLVLNVFVKTSSRYIMYTLPCWAILAGLTMDHVLANKRVSLLVVAGILPLTLYDLMWDDVAYFIGATAWVWRVLSAGACLVGLAVWLARAWPQRKDGWPNGLLSLPSWLGASDVLARPAVVLVIVYALAQPLVADALYHWQDGMRLDWGPTLSYLNREMGPLNEDVTISNEHQVIYYYRDHPVIPVWVVDVDDMVKVPGTAWFALDHGSQRYIKPEMAAWMDDHCAQVLDDGYMYRGHWWGLTLFECTDCAEP